MHDFDFAIDVDPSRSEIYARVYTRSLLTQAAVKAVNEVDVLKDDLDFVALGKRFSEQSKQQSESNINADYGPSSPQPSVQPASIQSSSEVPEDTAYWAAVQSALSSDKDPAGPESQDITSTDLDTYSMHITNYTILSTSRTYCMFLLQKSNIIWDLTEFGTRGRPCAVEGSSTSARGWSRRHILGQPAACGAGKRGLQCR